MAERRGQDKNGANQEVTMAVLQNELKHISDTVDEIYQNQSNIYREQQEMYKKFVQQEDLSQYSAKVNEMLAKKAPNDDFQIVKRVVFSAIGIILTLFLVAISSFVFVQFTEENNGSPIQPTQYGSN
jgi:hypothetical protein